MRENTVRLGLMPPLTGLVEMYGKEITRAGQIACDEVNESGGVLGRPLELVIEDDGSLPESAVPAANKLVDQRCVAIIGNLLSNSRIAVAYQVAEPRRIPYLNFSFYEGSILSRYFFHFAALPNQQIDKMIPYMRNKFGARMFFAGNNYEWPRGSIDAAKRVLNQLGGQVAGEEYCPIGASAEDIERLLDQVENAAPDVFVPYFAGIDQIHLLTRFTERGLKDRMAVVMGHYDEIMASSLPPEVREGFYSSNTYFMTLDTPENKAYLARLSSSPGVSGIWPQGNGILTNFGEGTYLCVKAFAKAANLAGNLGPDALVEALETIAVSGPQGEVQMDAATHHARVNTYLSRCQADGTFSIIEQFGAIEPILPERYRYLRIHQQLGLDEDIRFQARMLDQMAEAIFMVRASDGAIIYCNSGVVRMFGYGPGDLFEKHFSVILDPSDKAPEEAAAVISDIVREKGVWEGETRNITGDGLNIWCAVSVFAFTHPQYGEVWMISNKDITERKRVEEGLRLSELKNRLLFESSRDALMMVAPPSWKFTGANPATLKLFGAASVAEFAALGPWDVSPELQPDGRHSSEKAQEMIATAMREGSHFFEWKHQRLDGQQFDADVLLTRMQLGEEVFLQATVRDITERKRTEEELRSASSYARSLIEASLDPLVTISAEGKITDVNAATEEVTGWNRSQLIGADFSDYFTEPDRARAGYQQVFLKGFVTDYPLALRHRDGHVTDVLYNASVYRNETGEVLGVFAAARDISGSKKAEATRAQLAAIVEFSDDAIIGKTLDNVITSWNQGAVQMYGYTAREAVGKPVSLIVPEDRQQELQEFSDRIKKGERVKHHETVRMDRDGKRIDISLSLSPVFDESGAITRISAIARDITERKRDEALIRQNNKLLEKMFSSIQVMIAYLDRNFNFIKVNKAYAAADQREPDFYPGKNHFDLFPDEENRAIFRKVVDTGEPVVYYAKPFEYAEHPERGVSYWDWRLEPIKDASGKVEGLLFSLLNVTEQTLSVQRIRTASLYARSLIEASLDPLVTISAEGKITDLNLATEKVTGRSRVELTGTDFSDYFTEPDKAREGYRQVFQKGFVTDYPLALRHRDGHVTDVLYNASVYRDEAGKVLGVFAAARDVTERNKAEKEAAQLNMQNRLILDSAGEGIYGQDIDGICTFLNPAASQLLGFKAEELVGRNNHAMFHHSRPDGSPYPQEECPIRAHQAQGRIYRGSDLFWRKDGGSFPVELVSTPILDAGKVTGSVVAFSDITERKKAEAVLRESEEALKQAQRIAHLGSWHMDLATNQVVWSEVLYKMYGFDPALPPPLYTESMKLFTPESWERLSASIARTTETGIPYEIELEMVNKEGGRGWMLARGELVRDAHGAPVRVRGVVMDITERKLAENALREKEERLALATANNGVGVWDWNLQTQQMIWDDSMYTLYHIRREDFSGTEEAWRAALHPDDLTRGDQEVADAIAGRKPFETEFRVLWPNGEVRYIKAVAKVFRDDQGTPLRMLGINMDVSERRNAEIELRRSEHGLAEAQRIAHLGNWELDLVSNVLTWSDEIYRIFEIDPEKFGASYEAFLDAIHPDDRDMVNNAYTESVKNKVPYDIVHRLLMKDGRLKYVNEICETHYAFDGKPIRSIGTVHDITAQKVAEIALTALKDDLENRVKVRTSELETANKELEAFSYSVSHDLRAPLRAIDGFSHILLEDYAGKLDAEGKRLLNVVRDNTGRMGQLIDDILKFSRAGRLEITYSEIDMEGMAREVYEELKHAAGHGLQMEIGHIPHATGDRAMLRQVLVNLLSNAIKFTRAKAGARIEVGSYAGEDETVYFVKDNGAGFDMQYVGKLFGVFQRLHSEREFEGTGIGLAIVKRIVTRHGGRVWAEGKVGEGATIYIALPLKAV